MELSRFANTILFGTSLDEKLALHDATEPLSDSDPGHAIVVPNFPGRPASLSKVGQAAFPGGSQLASDLSRAQLLHFFANHELLALELMALVLLRFPEAPRDFRLGVAQTIKEEQQHLRMYIDRIRELGLDFGELAVNDYFWRSIKDMRSPLEFVTQMSLTFEQANLDYAVYYRDQVSRFDDSQTASLLNKVYNDEIGHVAHGLHWFNHWRDAEQSEWDCFRSILPEPMTPRRAKGLGFNVEGRRQAGLSDEFIRELELYTGSRGTAPRVWLHNPDCEAEIASGETPPVSSDKAERFATDLESVPLFLANESDIVLMKGRPGSKWLKLLQDSGIVVPEILKMPDEPSTLSQHFERTKLGGLEPWGWSPRSVTLLVPLAEHIVNSADGLIQRQLLTESSNLRQCYYELYSKVWITNFFRQWLHDHPETHEVFGSPNELPTVCSDEETLRNSIERKLLTARGVVLKAPLGNSGRQVKRLFKQAELDGPLGGWCRNILDRQSAVLVDGMREKVADLSRQLFIRKNHIRVHAARQFFTDTAWRYLGTELGGGLRYLSHEARRFLHSTVGTQGKLLRYWRKALVDLGQELVKRNYRGPAGVDALLWRASSGKLRLYPMLELNPRWTMGHVALKLERSLCSTARGTWLLITKRDLTKAGYSSFTELWQNLQTRHPLNIIEQNNSRRIQSGAIPTSDPQQCQSVMTLLIVGHPQNSILGHPNSILGHPNFHFR